MIHTYLLRPVEDLDDFELLDLFEHLVWISHDTYNLTPAMSEINRYHGNIAEKIKEIIKSRLVRLQSFENHVSM